MRPERVAVPYTKTTHHCPRRGCPRVISLRLFACRPHWEELPVMVRRNIVDTARLPTLDPVRRAALAAALKFWRGCPH